MQKIIFAHDIEATLKAAGLSYVLYKVTSWLSLYALIATSVVLAFTVPAVYFQNKKQIDAAAAHYSKLAKEKTSEYADLAHKQAAPHIETLIKKTGPVGSFISSKIPTRTAGSTVGSDHSASFKDIPETSTAHTTGASKFPEVPATSGAHPTTVEDVLEQTTSHVQAENPAL